MLLSAASARAQVTIVNGGTHPNFTQAIAAANNGDVLQAAAGTYVENPVLLNKDLVILATGGVHLAGSFTLQQCSSATRLIGLDITASPGTSGLQITDGSPSIEGCTMHSNVAARGAGARVRFTTWGAGQGFLVAPTFTDCTFRDNTAVRGGGVSVTNDPFLHFPAARATFENCLFESNVATSEADVLMTGGGADFGPDTIGSFVNCRFLGNSAGGYGGGLYAEGTHGMTLFKCLFDGNMYGDGGGGACLLGSSAPSIENCVFSNNEAFVSNNATGGGGLMVATQGKVGTLTVNNCLFLRNKSRAGAGAYIADVQATLGFCTFSRNHASFTAGGLCLTDTNTTISNSIFFGDSSPHDPTAAWTQEINYATPSAPPPAIPPTITFSDVAGSSTHVVWGPASDVFDVDPLFRTGTYSCPLTPTNVGICFLDRGASPCVDTGDPSALLPPLWLTTHRLGLTDINVVDMGFHYPGTTCP